MLANMDVVVPWVAGPDGSGGLAAAAPNKEFDCEEGGFVPVAGVALPNKVADWKTGAGFEVSGSDALGVAPNKDEAELAGAGVAVSFCSTAAFG